jgi:diguanylate cyclase (GGDEF)-like protein
MGNVSVGRSILVVDDDPAVRDFLVEALRARYEVTSAASAEEAVELIGKSDFDLVVTDLVLPGETGLSVLACAKSRDEFVEVLMISGTAAADSAAAAVNNGAGSYLIKPFTLSELNGRVEKMLAMRAFHLKSLRLMKDFDLVDQAAKGHVDDLASLYHFTRKLMLTLEISEVMRIMLEEANGKADAKFCTVEVCLPDYKEVYSMPQVGEIGKAALNGVFAENWDGAFVGISKDRFQSGDVPHYVYKGRRGEFNAAACRCLNFPLVVTGKTIGSLTVWIAANAEIDERQSRYLHILTSFTSPVIEHVYLDLQTRSQANTDNLTGIANHRRFYEALEREIARANRKKSSFALLLADIDNFKTINDTYGHQTGDAVIIDLAKRVTGNIRSGDLAARYGGEEFGVILPESDPAGALALSKRICESISGTPCAAGAKQKIPYTASFGLAYYDGNNPISKDELILSADKALYKSKAEGKNRVSVL